MTDQPSQWIRQAYACFLWVGIALFLGEVASLISSLSPSVAETVAAMLVIFLGPLVVMTMVIDVIGIGLSLAFPTEWPLLFMSFVSFVAWLKDDLWPEFCGNVWTRSLCTELAYAAAAIVFLACTLWFFLFKRAFARAWYKLSLGALASICWAVLVYAVGHQSIGNAMSVLDSIGEPGCISLYASAIPDECGTRVDHAVSRLRLFIGLTFLLPVLLLGWGTAKAWGRGERRSSNFT